MNPESRFYKKRLLTRLLLTQELEIDVSKFDEAMDASKAQMQSCNIDCNEDLLKSVTKALGPSIYNKDSNLVAAGDDKEVANIKKRFIAGKLGVEGPEADAAINHAIEKIGSSNRQKLRPVFYYLIVTYLNKESVYSWSPLLLHPATSILEVAGSKQKPLQTNAVALAVALIQRELRSTSATTWQRLWYFFDRGI